MEKKPLTPAQQAAIERMHAARAAKREEKKAAESERETAPILPKTDSDIEREARGDAKRMGQALDADKKVAFTIQLDPSLDSQNQIWERSFNGLILRFKRGVQYHQPEHIVRYIQRCTRIERGKPVIQEYQNGIGKQI